MSGGVYKNAFEVMGRAGISRFQSVESLNYHDNFNKTYKVLMRFIKNTIKFFLTSNLAKKIAIWVIINNDLFPDVFIKTPSRKLRTLCNLPKGVNETQLNQDIFALLINGFNSGYFLEIGANDGFSLSNTLYLEDSFGWHGILVEANPKYYDSLIHRKSIIVNKAITESDGIFHFTDAGLYGGLSETLDDTHRDITGKASIINVDGCRLEDVLSENQAPKVIDFVSIDVEGGEYLILKQLCDLKNYRFKCGCIEHNYRGNDQYIFKELLENAGYSVFWEGSTGHDLYFIDALS